MKYYLVHYSDVKALDDFRLDSEYWHPDFIKNSQLVSTKIKVSDLIDPNIDNIKSLHQNGDFEYLEISNISPYNYKTQTVNFEDAPSRAYYVLKKQDVVVSTVRPNRNAVAYIQSDNIIGSSGLCVLRAKGIEPQYLYAFCKTKYFIDCLVRANKASMYPAVSNSDILNTAILVPSDFLRNEIKKVISSVIDNQKIADKKFFEAQDLVISELNLTRWNPHRQPIIRSYNEVKEKERFDAEYFHPEKYHYLEQINNLAGDVIDHHFEIIQDMLDPTRITTSEEVYNYDLTDALRYFLDNDVELIEASELGSNKKQFTKGDIVVSRLRSYLKEIAIVSTQPDHKCVGSSEFIVFRPRTNKVRPEILLVYLRSEPVQSIIKWCQNGSNHPRFDEVELQSLKLPTCLLNIQDKVADIIQDGIDAYQKSKQLLEIAKHAIEIAIEQDENSAEIWLRNEVDKLDA